jgi:hypothetical protein
VVLSITSIYSSVRYSWSSDVLPKKEQEGRNV